MQFKSFLRIPTRTLNNWNEGRERFGSLNYPENCHVSQPGRAFKQPFPKGTEQSHSWDISRRPIDPDHNVARAVLPRDLGVTTSLTLCLLPQGRSWPLLPSRAWGLPSSRPDPWMVTQSSSIWTVQPVVKFLQHEVILQPELLTQGHGLLEEGASGDQISSPTKSAPWSILMLF